MEMFPFENIREGQEALLNDVKKSINERTGLIANAPTGIGKTAATISPALSYAMENGKVVLFLTPKHSQHRIVIETLRKIGKKCSVRIKATDIIGKKWMCPVDGIEILSTQDFNDYCNSVKKDEKCIFYNCTRNKEGFTQKACEVLEEMAKSEPLHAEEIKEKCKGLCPYEICLEHARKSSLIICDYYHIFSPIRSTFLHRINRNLEDLIIIVDEAHNLPERVRKILSGKITTTSLNYSTKEARAFGFHEAAEDIEEITKMVKGIARGMKERKEIYVKKSEFLSEKERPDDYEMIVQNLNEAALEIRESRKKSYVGHLARFIELWNGDDIGYARIMKKINRDGKAFVSLNYVCLDPMIITKDVIQDAHATILMSGTLSPTSMYSDLLGFGQKIIFGNYKSCFPAHNRLNLIIPDVTTQYSERTDKNIEMIADYITRICNCGRSSMAAFFPSYELRDRIMKLVRDKIQKNIFNELPNSTKEEKMRILDGFMRCENSLLTGVQAGSFAEGVDYFGNVLKCVMVVGISLTHPDLETQSLINYYDMKFQRGWEYGYIFPAMHRAIQSAGRCIRDEKDRAAVVFMDKRFLWKNYRSVFPVDMKLKITTLPERDISDFLSAERAI